VRSIARHQQPSRQARFQNMEMSAGSHLRKLTHQHIDVTFQGIVERTTMAEFAGELGRTHAQGAAAALHNRSQLRDVNAEHESCSQHPLSADQADFQPWSFIERGDERDEAAKREVNVLDAVTGVTDQISQLEFNAFAACDKPTTYCAW
jgi:hypothetical protein